MQVAKMFPVRKGSHPGKLLDHSPATSISLSKLADESQLGSLSKLLTPAHNNNVNDCNYESWSSDVPVDTVTNNCTQQYESNLHYKSFMPLKKRFRQDFPNEVAKEPLQESSTVSFEPVVSNNQDVSTETGSRTLDENVEDMATDPRPMKVINPPSRKNPDDIRESRTTKFRACKGERYKMFMNSNRRTRNKTNRWDLRQKPLSTDKLSIEGDLEIQQRINDLSNLDMEDYNKSQIRNKRPKKINKNKRKKRQLSPTKSTTSVDNSEDNKTETEDFLDMITEEQKPIKEEDNSDVKEEDLNVQLNGNNNLLNNKENGIFDGDINQPKLVDEIKSENQLKSFNTDINIDNVENKTGTVVGSRKRKLRKQNIMRLQPGSTFKDMRVVEDSVVCDLGTLAEVAVSSEQKTAQQNVQS